MQQTMEKKKIEVNDIVDSAAKMVHISEENKYLREDNQFLNDAYEAMSAEYMELLIEKHKLAKKVKRLKRLFRWMMIKYRGWKRRCKILEHFKLGKYLRLKMEAK